MSTLSSMFGCIECENPNPKLDSFLGRLTVWSCKEGDETEVGVMCVMSFDIVLTLLTRLAPCPMITCCWRGQC